MTYEIVPGGTEDLSAAGRVHAESWQDSHRAFCDADFVAAHTPERQTRYLADKLARGSRLFLLQTGGRVAGIVTLTGSLIEDLYILPQFQNRGLGTALLRYAIARCDGDPVLWLLENNVRAESLYRREGFAPTGRRSAITDALDEIEYKLIKPMEENKSMSNRDMNCAYCVHGEPLAKFGIYVCDLSEMNSLYLFREQSHPGRVIVAPKEHVGDFTELTDAQRDLFFADIARVSRALKKVFRPDKVNYGAYNDNGGHLHFHLVPKYRNEFEWGGVFAMNPGRVALSDAEYADMIEKIKAAL